jgi:hypothetical protein
MKAYVPPKRLRTLNGLHGNISQEIEHFNLQIYLVIFVATESL